MTEIWRPVMGFEGCYEVSNHGRVRSVDRMIRAPHGHRRHRGRVLRPAAAGNGGHTYVNLRRDGHGVVRRIHVLVLEAFIGSRPEGMECCHNNGIPYDNRLSNLRWDTKSENTKDRVRHGTHNFANKTHCPNSHPLRGLQPLRRRQGPSLPYLHERAAPIRPCRIRSGVYRQAR